jgi:ankyrin repeat protein
MCAAGRGHLDVVKALIALGADVNAKNETIDGRTALREAAEKGNVEVVKALLDKGADVNEGYHDAKTRRWTALTWAAWNGSSDAAKLLEGRGASKTLMDAACLGDLQLLQQLIREGASVDMKTLVEERTPLMGAARGGHLDVVKALIALGADVNAKTRDGRMPVIPAVENGHVEVVRLLLEKGADVTNRAIGRPALKIARKKGREEIAELLRAHGAKD